MNLYLVAPPPARANKEARRRVRAAAGFVVSAGRMKKDRPA
jgi:hypothetical protein